jgi:glycosyltransferase involved in cell wall biosynthesis
MIHNAYAKRADLIVAVSTDVAAEARQLTGLGDEEIVVIPNARDPDRFAPIPVDSDDRPVKLIFVGHLDSGKRPDWFIDVLAQLRRLGLPVVGAIVGDGPLAEELTESARSVGVEMLGRRSDVPRILAESDIFLFTSAPAGEGMPGVLIEAGMSGLATVATRVPGAGDVIEDGVTGFLVDVDDKSGLVDAAARLVTEPALRSSMGARARERCARLFSLEMFVSEWRSVLASLPVE